MLLSPSDSRLTRALAVLSTDMTAHKSLFTRTADRAAVGTAEEDGSKAPGSVFVNGAPEDRSLFISFLVHTADLCNPLLPPPVSARNAAALSNEFEDQAKREIDLSLPVTVMRAHDAAAKAKMVRPRGEILC